MAALQFSAQKVSDAGSSNPIVARAFYQWTEILRWYDLPQDRAAKVLEALFYHVKPRLLECQRLSGELRAAVETGRQTGLQYQAGGRFQTVPSAPRVKERAEDYLYEAKAALGDFSAVFGPLLGKDLPGGNILGLLNAVEKDTGLAAFGVFLRKEHDEWIGKLAAMRDGVEHRRTTKRPLDLWDFTVDVTDPQRPILHAPTWQLAGEPRTYIAEDMQAYDHNLLTFVEDAMMEALKFLPLHAPIAFAEIPENKRNPENPVRFRPVLGLPPQ